MSTDLATTAGAPEPRRAYATSALSLREIDRIADYAADSRYFEKATSKAQCFMKILAGQELGLSPTQSLAYLHIVEGKPTMDATMVRARIRQSERYDYRIERFDDEGATIIIVDKGKDLEPVTFDKAAAQKAELLGKNVWKRYPRAMYLARATTVAARTYCADIFNGPVYTPDEVGATIEVNAEGEITRVETGKQRTETDPPKTVTPLAASAAEAPPSPATEAPAHAAPETALETRAAVTDDAQADPAPETALQPRETLEIAGPAPLPTDAIAYIEVELARLHLPEEVVMELTSEVSLRHDFSTYSWRELSTAENAKEFIKAARKRAKELAPA